MTKQKESKISDICIFYNGIQNEKKVISTLVSIEYIDGTPRYKTHSGRTYSNCEKYNINLKY